MLNTQGLMKFETKLNKPYDKNLKLHAVTTEAIAIKKLFHTPLHTEHPADAERPE